MQSHSAGKSSITKDDGLPAEEVYQSWQNDPQEFNRITDLIHLHADPNSYFF